MIAIFGIALTGFVHLFLNQYQRSGVARWVASVTRNRTVVVSKLTNETLTGWLQERIVACFCYKRGHYGSLTNMSHH